MIIWQYKNFTTIKILFVGNYEPKKMMELKRGENALQGSQDCCHIVLFFKSPMFELQPCHFFCAYYGKLEPKEVKCNNNNNNNFTWCDVKI